MQQDSLADRIFDSIWDTWGPLTWAAIKAAFWLLAAVALVKFVF